LGTADITISALILKNGASTVDYTPTIMMLGEYPGNRVYLVASKTDGYACFMTYGGTGVNAESTVNVCDNAWHIVTGVREGTTVKIYVDGSLVGSNTGTAQSIDGKTLAFGTANYDPNDVLGSATIGLSQISDSARSAAWIKATYHSLWDSLGTYGTEETYAGKIAVATPFTGTFSLTGAVKGPTKVTATPFTGTFSLTGAARHIPRTQFSGTLSLVNSLKLGSTLTLVNSLNVVVNGDITLAMDILSKIEGSQTLRHDIENLAKTNGTLSLINHILDADSGITQGDYYFLRNHGI
jgi:hypothetical protein